MTSAEAIRFAGLIETAYSDAFMAHPPSAPMPDGYEFIDWITSDEFATVSPAAVIARDTVDGACVCAVRGSVDAPDWFEDFRFAFTASPFGVGRTEEGFTAIFKSLIAGSGNPLPQFSRLAGHSLGGPIATYLAIRNTKPKFFTAIPTDYRADLLLIATPMPGDIPFCADGNSLIRSVTRWENPWDVVPDAPGRWLGFGDVGQTTAIDMTNFVDRLDVAGNHSLTNYITAAKSRWP